MTNNKRLTQKELNYLRKENEAERICTRYPTDKALVAQLLNEHAEAVRLLAQCVAHLNYIGWGDSYEREGLCGKGELSDQAVAFLKDAVTL